MQEQIHLSPEDRPPRRHPRMGLGSLWPLLLAAAVGAGAYLYTHPRTPPEPEPVALPRAPDVEAPPRAAPPAVHYPVPETPPEAAEPPPLPALQESDAAVRDALAGLAGGLEPLALLLTPENIVRRIVATIDALPREKIPMRIRVVPPVAGSLVTAGPESELTLAAENGLRYAPIMQIVRAIDVRKLAEVYFRFYPLFEEAYDELGFRERYFNDRLIEVIDHLLATPQVPDPIPLLRPGVFYRFADPDLEARSGGQKALLRIGRENAQVVKAKLEVLRQAIASASE
jgi:hypothetical protein